MCASGRFQRWKSSITTDASWTSIQNAATGDEMDDYPGTVYHHVVDRSMSDGEDSVLDPTWSTQTVSLLAVETAREHSGQGCS